MAQFEPKRTQSTTSLARFANGERGGPPGQDDLTDPKMDFCNAFWGSGERGYEVLMARLRGAGRTLDELKHFWKERAAIEEEYAKRLTKLSKAALGKDEIGELAGALQNVLVETAQQAQYHVSLAAEIRTTVEAPTAELGARLIGLKKGQQAGIEKAWKNKASQEGHVAKAKEKYESECLKLNSYHANQNITQGREADKLQYKAEKTRQTIGQSEQEFRQFVRLLEGTQSKWETDWKAFCDDLEEDRLAMTKDIIWAYANAVSSVCVEDDTSCERIREKLEHLEPQNDMITFVKGWGTGDQIPDPPRFVNYSAGEHPSRPTAHVAAFQRESNKPPLSALSQYTGEATSAIEPEPAQAEPVANGQTSGWEGAMGGLNIRDGSAPPPPAPAEKPKAPFGGVALPGMAPQVTNQPITTSPTTSTGRAPSPAPAASGSLPKRYSSMGPPPVPPAMTMPEPRVPSRQGPPTPSQVDDDDPMAKALADLRRDPPPPDSVRRNTSHRRPDSTVSTSSNRGGIPRSSSPVPGTLGSIAGNNNRASYQAPPGPNGVSERDMTLSPPTAGHTAAALARSMDDFQRQSNKRASTSYNNVANDLVGAHPSSRSASPAPGARGPSPAMMQPPSQPATHIADQVLSGYHQAFPGERERSRSRAGSVASHRSAGSYAGPPQPPTLSQTGPPRSPSPAPREGFTGIGAGGRSASPAPGMFASPQTSPAVPQGPGAGALGPQNMGIKLDASGGVAQDSMAEAYRRQYQQQMQGQGQGGAAGGGGGRPGSYVAPTPASGQGPSQYGGYQPPGPPPASVAGPAYGQSGGPPPVGGQRPTSGMGYQQTQQPYGAPQPQQAYGGPPRPHQQSHPSYTSTGPTASGGGYANSSAPPSGYTNSYAPPGISGGAPGRPTSGYGQTPPPHQQQQSQGGYNAPPPRGNSMGRVSQDYGRSASPAPAPQNQYRAPSPAPVPAQQQPYAQQSYQPPQQQRPPVQQQQSYNQGGYGGQGGYQPASPAQYNHQHREAQAYQPPPLQSQPQQQQQQGQRQERYQRSPSPQPGVPPQNAAPTGQWSTTGLPVLFYVKALYDYTALSAAEFDFQAGDIIAVTSTPEDGWWSGELLDEARRHPGRTDFPSNFVCLF